MSDKYIPTTEDVRRAYQEHCRDYDAVDGLATSPESYEEEFDRWLESDKAADVDWLREISQGLLNERDEARDEVDELRAWQAQTVRRVRDTAASEHYAMLVVEDIPNADFGELIDRLKRERDEARAEIRNMLSVDIPVLKEERDDARAALKAKDSYVGDLEEQLQHIKSLWRATGRAETDAHRRAVRAEAAIEWVRIAATEVANQGDNLGATHYENCWQHHLHCLAAKIIYETEADDE